MNHILSVKVSDQQSGELMIEFLRSPHVRTWGQIIGDDSIKTHSWIGPHWGTTRKNFLVFEYVGVGGGEREYLFALVRWIALRIGDRNKSRILPQYLVNSQEWVVLDYTTFLGFPKRRTDEYLALDKALALDGMVRSKRRVQVSDLYQEFEHITAVWKEFWVNRIATAGKRKSARLKV
jgi:hypothetical protein